MTKWLRRISCCNCSRHKKTQKADLSQRAQRRQRNAEIFNHGWTLMGKRQTDDVKSTMASQEKWRQKDEIRERRFISASWPRVKDPREVKHGYCHRRENDEKLRFAKSLVERAIPGAEKSQEREHAE